MTQTHAVKVIQRLERKPNSVNGNPAWIVHFTDGTSARTQSDAAISYALDNPEYKNAPVRVDYTAAGRIRHVEVHTEQTGDS